MFKPINQRVADTDIFVFGFSPETASFSYSRQFTPEEAESLSQATNQAIKGYNGARGLRQGLTVIGGELANMSTLKGIVANKVLMNTSNGEKRFSTIAEGLALNEAGMLTPNVLIDFWIALYDGESPDTDIAQAMMAVAKSRGYTTPILASFASLGLASGGKRYGVTPQLASENGLITGQEAVKLLEKFAYKGNSGVRRLSRCRDDVWNAGWDVDLDGFYGGCRVGRYSTEGDEKKLEQEAAGEFTKIKTSLDSILQLVA